MDGTNQCCEDQYGVGRGDEIQIYCKLLGNLCSPEISGEECSIREEGNDGEDTDTHSIQAK